MPARRKAWLGSQTRQAAAKRKARRAQRTEDQIQRFVVDRRIAIEVCSGDDEVGRLVECSQADDRYMIQLVKERPLLYARTTLPVASYYAQVKTLWQEVANHMGWTVAEVRRKWSHIRNSYSRHLRNEIAGARTGRGRVVSRWYLADELDFLKEHMATDTRPSPYSVKMAPSLLTMQMSSGTSNVVGSGAGNVASDDELHWRPLPLWPNDTSGAINAAATVAGNAAGFTADENNSSYFQFFRGIYNDYLELSASRQRRFRRSCVNMLHDLLDEEDSGGDAGAGRGRTGELRHSAAILSDAVLDYDSENEQKYSAVLQQKKIEIGTVYSEKDGTQNQSGTPDSDK